MSKKTFIIIAVVAGLTAGRIYKIWRNRNS